MIESFLIHYVWFGVMMFVIAFLVGYGIYPLVLRMARVWKIYDNPDERKLQRKPVPVLGGLAVFCAICVPSVLLLAVNFNLKIVLMLAAMALLLLVGIMDDRFTLSVQIRFAVEALVVLAIIFINDHAIDHLSGIWGIGTLPMWVAVPLSLVAGIGIINAINLIDGVDGYVSAYSMMTCVGFSLLFYAARIPFMAIMCLICAGSLLPFFLHNVFGKSTKMFIGDGGTLMIGVMLVVYTFSVLKGTSFCQKSLLQEHNVGLIPVVLALLSVCVFDTLRVMATRLLQRRSPFRPDKTHLHHLFIDMGFSHLGTTLSIVSLNLLVVMGWGIAWLLDASVTQQFYVVAALSLVLVVGFYIFMRYQERRNGRVFRRFCSIGQRTHWEEASWWKWMQKMVDGNLFEGGKFEA